MTALIYFPSTSNVVHLILKKKKERERNGGIKIIQLAFLHVRHVCCRYGGWPDCAA